MVLHQVRIVVIIKCVISFFLFNMKANNQNNFRATDSSTEHFSKEQLLYNHFSKKFEELLRAKCMAESRLTTYLTEVLLF